MDKTTAAAIAAELLALADKYAAAEADSYGGATDAYSEVVYDLRKRAAELLAGVAV